MLQWKYITVMENTLLKKKKQISDPEVSMKQVGN